MDLDKLLAKRAATDKGMPEDDVPVLGGTVRVRGLTRREVMKAQQVADLADRECRMLALGVVDPAMTEAQARQWQEVADAGELEPVTDRIAELSGMRQGATKSGVPEAGD